jgi:two-component system phosphate regulon sensor histidine kinase PhoR
MFRSLRARLVFAYVALIVGALLVLALLLNNVTQNFYAQDLRAQLVTDSRLVADIVAPLLTDDAHRAQLDATIKQLGRDANVRVTIIRPDGLVLADTDESPASMDNHADRPEVRQALATGYGDAVRFSRTVQRDLLYVATTLSREQTPLAVVRVAVLLRAVDEVRAQITTLILSVGAAIALVAIALTVFIARRLTSSLDALQRTAARFAQGDLQARARASSVVEINHVAQTLNTMADQLDQTIHTLRAEEARLSAILAHMADGLLVVDARGRVVQLNEAAEKMLGARAAEALGQSFLHLARDYELHRCLQQAMQSAQEQTQIIEQSGAHRFLRMVATPIQSEDAAPTYLVMLQDLTQLRRLETIRRDFISNISHELRTPLASVQALVETLSDGALDDPPAARHFIAQMEHEVHQLTQLINELLDLSSIESGKAPLTRQPTDIVTVVHRAVERLQAQATRANLSLTVADSAPIIIMADGARIEQVLVNLMHNAIKFTSSGGQIECQVVAHPTHVTVSVRDTGIGISTDDLPRIFERFYKVDKARAGSGTGLGLAIAKHVIEQHGGHIGAESVEGQGTTVIFTLPRN